MCLVLEMHQSECNPQRLRVEEFPSGNVLPQKFLSMFKDWSLSIRRLRELPTNAGDYENHGKQSCDAFNNSLSILEKRDNAIVIGSGNLIDVPYEQLLEIFGTVSFSDIDVNSTRNTLLSLDSEKSSNIDRLIREDITGVYFNIIKDLDSIFYESLNLEQTLNRIIQKLDGISDETEKIDMNPLATILGKDSYDFVSSSFVSSQLTFAILVNIQTRIKNKYKYELGPVVESTQNKDQQFFISFTKFTNFLISRHFELLAKIIKPEGVLHLSVTPGILYFKRDLSGEIHLIKNGIMLDMPFINVALSLFFTPQNDLNSNWIYVKHNPLNGQDSGEAYQATSIPCKPKLKEGGKIDDWSNLE